MRSSLCARAAPSRCGIWKKLLQAAFCSRKRYNAGGSRMQVLLAALKACGILKDVENGRRIHTDLTGDWEGKEEENMVSSNLYVRTALLDMYSKCGNLLEARRIFESMEQRDVVALNSLMMGCVENGQPEAALELFYSRSCIPNSRTYVVAFKACSSLATAAHDEEVGKLKSLERGISLHNEAANGGCELNIFVATALIDMYSKCGSLRNAWEIFSRMPCHDAVSLNSMILGLVANGESQSALDLFSAMQKQQEWQPDALTYVSALVACGALADKEHSRVVNGKGMKVEALKRATEFHSQAAERNYCSHSHVASSLVDLYAKCGSMEDAYRVFSGLQRRDVVLWTALIAGYVLNSESQLALKLFNRMEAEGCSPNARTYVAALMACSNLAEEEQGKAVDGKIVKVRALEKGMDFHSRAAKSGFDLDVFVASTLVDMYAKCGTLPDSRAVFDKMTSRNVVTWTALILGYVQNGEAELALRLFQIMQDEGCKPNAQSYVAAMTACASLACVKSEDDSLKSRCLEKGVSIHASAAKHGFASHIFVANALIHMYAKCASMVNAWRVFEGLLQRDVVSWNALILGYAVNGDYETALQLFTALQSEEEALSPDGRTFVAALVACAGLASKEQGKKVTGRLVKQKSLQIGLELHYQASKKGYDLNVFVASTLVTVYARCGNLEDARRAFEAIQKPDVVMWNALMLGFVEGGEETQDLEFVLETFSRMQKPPHLQQVNALSFIAALMACAKLASREEDQEEKRPWLLKGAALHAQAADSGLDSDFAVASTLLDMYAKCGCMVEAQKSFDNMKNPDTVAWTSLIFGYAANGDSNAALEMFYKMVRESGVLPDAQTFIAATTACANSAAFEAGRKVHAEICRYGFEDNEFLATSLVDFYAKCGCMAAAQSTFDSMATSTTGDIILWNCLIAGYGCQGDLQRSLETFTKMEQCGLEADEVSFITLLAACSHAGAIEKGKKIFEAMRLRFGLEPGLKHYRCMVDLLGRASKVEEAAALAQSMPFKGDALAWTTVLGACSKWKNVEVGKRAFQSLLKLGDSNASTYVLMANLIN